MTRSLKVLATVASLISATAPVAAEMQRARLPADSNRVMRVFGTALPPFGFVQFCETFPRECAQHPVSDTRFDAGRERMRELDEINRQVNKQIKAATDQELYGVAELWTLPKDKGDCEDYALLKRQILMKRGWPASALLMTVVRDEKGEGHAILTARTAQGDFILDNKVDEIKLWNATPYQFVMRQSYLNPRVWMSLDPRDGVSPGFLAGVQGVR